MHHERKGLVSVIVPVYNTEAYLARCLDSLLNNTYKNIEIICVDDGSTDGSAALLRLYERKDSRIGVISTEKGGVSRARNLAMEKAEGEFIAFVDADDWVHRDFFKILTDCQRKHDSDVTIASCVSANEQKSDEPINDRELKAKVYKNEKALKDTSVWLHVWRKLYRSSAISDVRFAESVAYGEDTCLIFELYEKHPDLKTAVLPCRLYYYFYRADSATHSNCAGDAAHCYSYMLGRVEAMDDKSRARYYMTEIMRRSIAWIEVCDKKGYSAAGRSFRETAAKAAALEKKHRICPLFESLMYRFFIRYPAVFAFLHKGRR